MRRLVGALTLGFCLALSNVVFAASPVPGYVAGAPLAPGSPPSLFLPLVVSPTTATQGVAISPSVIGQSLGSNILVKSSDGSAIYFSSGYLLGSFNFSGSPVVTLTETGNALNSPKTTSVVFSVASITSPIVVGPTPGSTGLGGDLGADNIGIPIIY